MLAQLLVLVFAPFLALITLAVSSPNRALSWAEPLATGAGLWGSKVEGRVGLQGWDRSEVALVAAIGKDSGDEGVALEVRPVAGGLAIEVRIPPPGRVPESRQSSVCHLAIRVPRRFLQAGRLSSDG